MSTADIERRRRTHELVLGYRIFGALRWGDLGDGHISARDPERTECFWLLRHGVSFDRATGGDLVLVDQRGAVVEGSGEINPAAHAIHHPIHMARPDVVSIAHTHTPWGTPLSTTCRPVLPITQEACAFVDDVATFDDEEVVVLQPTGGERIARCLGGRRAAVLRHHGLLTVGASVAQAVAGFVLLERVAEAVMKAPDATPLSAAGATRAKADLDVPVMLEDGFQWLVARHLGRPFGSDISPEITASTK